jgi:hypothetical protein
MATKRRKLASRQIGIPSAAIDAWRSGDFHGLNRALGIRPWQPTPWPIRVTAFGVDQGSCPTFWNPDDYERAQQLQRALLEAAGEPPARLMEG